MLPRHVPAAPRRRNPPLHRQSERRPPDRLPQQARQRRAAVVLAGVIALPANCVIGPVYQSGQLTGADVARGGEVFLVASGRRPDNGRVVLARPESENPMAKSKPKSPTGN